MQQLRHDTAAIGQSNQERGFGFQLLQDRQRIDYVVLSDVIYDLDQILLCRVSPQHLIGLGFSHAFFAASATMRAGNRTFCLAQ